MQNTKLTYEEFKRTINDIQSEFINADNHLLKLTIKKFFNKAVNEVIDYELVEYVRKSRVCVGEYKKIAIMHLALDVCNGADNNHYFEELINENSFEHFRKLAFYVL